MNTKSLLIFFIGFALLAGCASRATPTPAPVPPTAVAANTAVPFPLTLTPEAVTPLPGVTLTAAPNVSGICSDPQATALINSFKTAVLNSDGMLLSSLISPTRGMDVAFLRDGTVITYTPEHGKFLFETTFEVDWGVMPGSGLAKSGSFHDVVVPELVKAFNQPYTLHCNELKHGGATYELEWPYEGDFYSVHFPGTEANGNLDWHTWVVGVEYVNNKPTIYALMQFFWEP
ncbi:MAG: hypothetical protein JW730_21540 [Anaerolineales bacterium]|nr:hypothetical protein [Anaerolineales bacterium]